MMSAELFDKLNRVAQLLRGSKEPFGGMQLVLSGDFLQLPCINGSFCFEAGAWKLCNFRVFNLKLIQRQHDMYFQECLNSARVGTITKEQLAFCMSGTKHDNPDIKPTKILCCNVDVDEINNKKLAHLGAIKEYPADVVVNVNKDLGNISKYCNAPDTLRLALGAQVMLLVNHDVEKGLVNGSRGVVTAFERDLPVVRFTNGMSLTLDFHPYEVKEDDLLICTIYQVPLRLAYAITVHKSQGLTLDACSIDLNNVFEYGQAYVALSRVRDIKGLVLKNASTSSFKAHPTALAFIKELS
jgi:ATP-dependent DNA helicase PIF1